MKTERIGLGEWILKNLHQFTNGIVYSIKHKNLITTIKINIIFFLGLLFFTVEKKLIQKKNR